MPATPVYPSKRVLRALRHLALGTSCSVALGVGLITEERRRAIRSVQRINDNAKKLKTCRQYHGAGSEAFARLADQYAHDGDSVPSENQSKRVRWGDEAPAIPRTTRTTKRKSIDQRHTIVTNTINADQITTLDKLQLVPRRRSQPSVGDPIRTKSSDRQIPVPIASSLFENGRENIGTPPVKDQNELYKRLKTILESSQVIDNIAEEAAVDMLVESIGKQPLEKRLHDMTVKLSVLCRERGHLEACRRILQAVIATGPIDGQRFIDLNPQDIIMDLLEFGDITTDEERLGRLRQATEMFLAEVTKPIHTRRLNNAALRLLRLSLRHRHYSDVEAVFLRMFAWDAQATVDGSESPSTSALTHEALRYLLYAKQRLGKHRDVVDQFSSLYATSIRPDQRELNEVTEVVLNSAIALQDWDMADEILSTVSRIAQEGRLKILSSWFKLVLKAHNQAVDDPILTQSLNVTLLANAAKTQDPKMIKDLMGELQSNFEQNLTEGVPDSYKPAYLNEISTLITSASKGHWDAVKEEYMRVKELRDELPLEYQALILPLLKLYSRSHTHRETLGLLAYFQKDCDIKVSQHVLTFMLNYSSKVGDFPSMLKLIQSDRAASTAHASFHWYLTHCHELGMPFERLFNLCKSIRETKPKLLGSGKWAGDILVLSAMKCANGEKELRNYLLRVDRLLFGGRDVVTTRKGRRLKLDMLFAGTPLNALAMFRTALRQRSCRVGVPELRLAVESSIEVYGINDLQPTLNLIDEAKRLGNVIISDTFATLSIRMIDAAGPDPDRIKEIVKETSNRARLYGQPFPRDVAAHAAWALVAAGKNQLAAELLRETVFIPDGHVANFDIVNLTVLYTAYVNLRDAVGLNWTMNLFFENSLVPDRAFVHKLKKTRDEIRKQLLYSPECKTARDCLRIIERVLPKVRRMMTSLRSDEAENKMIPALFAHLEQTPSSEKDGPSRHIGTKTISWTPHSVSSFGKSPRGGVKDVEEVKEEDADEEPESATEPEVLEESKATQEPRLAEDVESNEKQEALGQNDEEPAGMEADRMRMQIGASSLQFYLQGVNRNIVTY